MRRRLFEWKPYWKKRCVYYRAVKEWNQSFPPVSFHSPYVSAEEMEKVEQILKERKIRRIKTRQHISEA